MIFIAQTVIFMIFYWTSADVMNIIVAIIVRLKRATECIKMHHLEGEHANFFSAEGAQPTTQAQPVAMTW